MKLFVWENAYYVPYGESLVLAVAESIEEARRLAASKCSVALGEPTSIHEVPCAVTHEWSE